jgi:hypothetical protein
MIAFLSVTALATNFDANNEKYAGEKSYDYSLSKIPA